MTIRRYTILEDDTKLGGFTLLHHAWPSGGPRTIEHVEVLPEPNIKQTFVIERPASGERLDADLLFEALNNDGWSKTVGVVEVIE
jgi:hypothetical protein